MATPTEVLMEVLEEFGKSEAVNVLVVYKNEANDMCICSTFGYVEMIGVGEWVKKRGMALLDSD